MLIIYHHLLVHRRLGWYSALLISLFALIISVPSHGAQQYSYVADPKMRVLCLVTVGGVVGWYGRPVAQQVCASWSGSWLNRGSVSLLTGRGPQLHGVKTPPRRSPSPQAPLAVARSASRDQASPQRETDRSPKEYVMVTPRQTARHFERDVISVKTQTTEEDTASVVIEADELSSLKCCAEFSLQQASAWQHEATQEKARHLLTYQRCIRLQRELNRVVQDAREHKYQGASEHSPQASDVEVLSNGELSDDEWSDWDGQRAQRRKYRSAE